MSIVVGLLDLIGTVGFLVAFYYMLRLYHEEELLKSYWLAATVAAALLSLWAATEAVQWLSLTTLSFNNPAQPLLMSTAVTAIILLALYDNTENESLLRELAVSERLNWEIIDNYPDGAIVLFDRELRVLIAGGNDLLGLTSTGDELVELGVHEAFPSSLARTLEPAWQSAVDHDGVTIEVTRDGRTYRVRTLPVSDTSPARARGLMIVQDITERVEREQTLREQRNELETLDRINQVIRNVDQALVRAQTREEAERSVCETLTGSGPYRFALVAEFRDDGNLHARTWSGIGEEYVSNVFPVQYTSGAEGPSVDAVETGHTQIFSDLKPDPNDPDDWRHHAEDHGYRTIASVPISHRDTDFGALVLYANRPDAFDEREQAVLDQLGETMGYALTAIERKERVDVLASLHGATETLLGAETPDDVAEVIGNAADELLDVEIAIFGYDDADHQLRPLMITDPMVDFYGEDPAYSPSSDDSITWETFVSGETAVYDDLQAADQQIDPDIDARGAVFLPMGDHGVFVAASTVTGAFDEQRRHLVKLLAATAEAAFDRLESEADLRRREDELREQNFRLRKLERVNDVIRDVDRTLVRARSREEIEQTVCERLSAEDRFRFAWIGELDSSGDIVPRAWAGEGTAYLDVTGFALNEAVPEPTAQTAASNEPTVAAPITDYLQTSEWVSRALDQGFQSAVSVPIVYHDTVYGVLSVYAVDPEEFDEQTTAVLSELGETIAYAIDASETKRGLLANDRTELELRIIDPGTPLSNLASSIDRTITAIDTTPQADGVSQLTFNVTDGSVDDIDALTERLVGVTDIKRVANDDGTVRYAVTLCGDTLAGTVVELGAIPQSIEATADEIHLVVSLFPHIDVRQFVERMSDHFGTVELLARRERGGTDRTHLNFVEEFEEVATSRQLEVLRTAYEEGYFETPRESSGQDVADTLGVSQPTVNHHLRESERRLLSLLFGDRDRNSREEARDDR